MSLYSYKTSASGKNIGPWSTVLTLAEAKAIPDVTVSLGGRYYQDEQSAGVVALVSVPLPVFDRNLKGLAEKVEAEAVLAHVRGVAYSTAVDISLANVHPFQFPGAALALAHNGDLARFAELKPRLAAHVPAEIARP